MRVAVLFDSFGPYHVARLTAAANKMDILGIELKSKSNVYSWDRPDLPNTLSHTILFPEEEKIKITWKTILKKLDAQVAHFRPSAIAVPGWSSLAAIATAYWAKQHDIPVILMSESNFMDFNRHYIIEFLKKIFLYQFSAAICGSDLQKNYLIKLGFNKNNIFLGYNAVDNDYFKISSEKFISTKKMPKISVKTSLNEKYRNHYFLTSARFIEKKNLIRLLDSYFIYQKNYNSENEIWPLVILGDGDMRPQIQEKINALNLYNSVYLPGFLQYQELPEFYATAGAFILASTTEQWGLVVNEAMASGLPVLVSNRVGCNQALVEEGVNGYTFDPKNTQELANKMSIITNSDHLLSMGAASQRIISNWGPERFANGLTDAVQCALSNSSFHSKNNLLLTRLFGFVQSYRK